MRIAICEFGRETNTFAKGLVTYSDIIPAWIPANNLIPRPIYPPAPDCEFTLE